eukprot:TRINITY_DN12667_c0_g1_i1.p1 TRINITY_DN12667_c0_g1~~TRINITY_DN12667_c0_g1_i1.p1  ORF type:complete len:737 (-),score=79.69 TRINITY_DN12667_c0_g1_i1:652-2862(-)
MPPRSTRCKSVADLAESLVVAHEQEVNALLQRVHDLEQTIRRYAPEDTQLVPLDFHDIPSVKPSGSHPSCDDTQSFGKHASDECISTSYTHARSASSCAASMSAQSFTAVDKWRRVVQGMLNDGPKVENYVYRSEFSQERVRRSSSANNPAGDAVLDMLAQLAASEVSRPSFHVGEYMEGQDDRNDHWACRLLTLLMVYPYSNVRLAWVLSAFGLLLIDLVDLSLEAFRRTENEARIEFLRYIMLGFWCFDIIMSFLTGVAVNERLEMRPARVAAIYLRGWFTFDVLVLVPDIMDVLLDDLSNAFGFFRHIKILRYLRLFRMVRVAKIRYLLKILDTKINSIVLLLSIRMCGATCCIVAWIHVSACFWYMAGSADDSGWVIVESVNELSLVHRYLFSVQWAAAQFQGSPSVGSGQSMICLTVATIIIVLSVIFMATFFSRLTNIMHELLQLHNSRVQTMTRVKALITSHKISPQLSFMVQRFTDLSMRVGESKTSGIRDQVLDLLPSHLRKQLIVEMLYPQVAKHIFIMAIRTESDVMFKQMLYKAMSERFYHHGEPIFSSGEVATHVYMSVVGALEYKHLPRSVFIKFGYEFAKAMTPQKCKTKRESATSVGSAARRSIEIEEAASPTSPERKRMKIRSRVVPEGSLVGEAGVWVFWCHEGGLESVAEASMLDLNLAYFRELLEKFPGVTARLQLNAERFLSVLDDPDQDAKDLLNSSEVLKKLGYKLYGLGSGA